MAFHIAEVSDHADLPVNKAPPPPVLSATPTPVSDNLNEAEPALAQDQSIVLMEETEELEVSFHPEVKERLTKAIQRITDCYPEDKKPPALADLKDYVDKEDFIGLRAGISDVWNSVLSYHSTQGIPPNRKVTHVFNLIHGMVGGT